MAEPELATAVRDEGSVLHEAGGCSARRIGWSGNSDGQAEGWRRWEGPGPKAQTANYQLAPEHRSYHGLPRSLLLPPTQGDSHSSLSFGHSGEPCLQWPHVNPHPAVKLSGLRKQGGEEPTVLISKL